MPNWCEDRLEVRGPADDLRRFYDQAKGPEPTNGEKPELLCFNNFVPRPPEPIPSPDHMPGWWHWCIQNWGTKWEPNEVNVVSGSIEEEVVVYDFMTAWSPPCPAVAAMAKQFPTLHFVLRYREPGIGFEGIFEVEGENVEQDVQREVLF